MMRKLFLFGVLGLILALPSLQVDSQQEAAQVRKSLQLDGDGDYVSIPFSRDLNPTMS